MEEMEEQDAFAARRAALLRSVSQWAAHMHDSEYFCDVTAAALWELPLPGWVVADTILHIGVSGRAPRARGVRGHQIRPSLVRIVEHPERGVRLTDPASTWASLARRLPDVYDLVAVGDAIVRQPRIPGPHGRFERPPLGAREELAGAIEAGRRVGIARLRLALPLVRLGSASRTETWSRLVLIEAGLPEPELDVDIYDDHGSFFGCVDLAYRERRIAIEYEGDQHRTDPAQWQRDIEKHQMLADIGWRVVRVSRQQLFAETAAYVRRVRRLLAD